MRAKFSRMLSATRRLEFKFLACGCLPLFNYFSEPHNHAVLPGLDPPLRVNVVIFPIVYYVYILE